MEVDANLKELVDAEVEICRCRALEDLRREGYRNIRALILCIVKELGVIGTGGLVARDGIEGQAMEALGTAVRDVGALCLRLGVLCELPGRVRRERGGA